MRFATLFLLIFVAMLATNAEPAKKKRSFRLPLKRVSTNTTALYRRAKGPIPAKFESHILFTVSVAIGDPGQMFDLVVDTGYPDIIVADYFCKNCGDPVTIPLYNGGKSKSFEDLKQSYSAYRGTLRGEWTSDKFVFPPFSITRPFARLTKVFNTWATRGKYSGLLGLGLHKAPPYLTLLDYMSQNNLLDTDVFGVRLVKDDPKTAGEIVFGDIDQQHIDGELERIPILSDSKDALWIIPIEDVQINHKSMGNGIGYLDTGIQYVYLDYSTVQELYSGTGAQNIDGVWAVPDPFPNDVSFVIGGSMYTIPKGDIPMKQLPKRGNLYRGAIQIASVSRWGLGIPFIQNYYVAFDFRTGIENIGLGKRK